MARWSKAIGSGRSSTGCQAVSEGRAGSSPSGTRPRYAVASCHSPGWRAGSLRGGLVPSRRLSRSGGRSRAVHPDASGSQGRRRRALLARAARHPGRPRPPPRRVAARHRLPRPRPARARPRPAPRHCVASRRRPPRADRLRPPRHRPRGARAAAGQALLHQHRLRPRPRALLDLGAERHLQRRARIPGRPHQPAPRARAPRPARGHRRAARARPRRRPPGGDLPLHFTRTRGDRPVRGAAAARRLERMTQAAVRESASCAGNQ